ncbi:MAG: glycosyltransferase family 4 protein [Patescibacteria group bacterium]
MKILLINKFHYLKGGSERVYFDTKKILEENGHEVVCFSMKDERNLPFGQSEYFVDHIDFSAPGNWWKKISRYFYYPEATRKLEQLIVNEKPDIAHLHNIYHQLTPSILAPLKKHKIPVVMTLHDYQLICPNYQLFQHGRICEHCRKHKYYHCFIHRCVQNSFPASLMAAKELLLNWLFGFYQRGVDFYISPSNFLKEKFVAWGIKKQIEVINNFIELSKFEPNYLPGDYVVCVSRLSREKGMMTLLRAIRKLPTIKLKLIGDGPMMETIKNYLQKKQIKNVELMRYDSNTVFDLVRNSRFKIIASEWYENYPMVVLEAMALGKPVLAANVGGLKEMIKEGETGWFFEAGNIKDLRLKIKTHFNGVEDIERLGRNARQAVEQKNCSSVYYEKLADCYNKVLPDGRKG